MTEGLKEMDRQGSGGGVNQSNYSCPPGTGKDLVRNLPQMRPTRVPLRRQLNDVVLTR